MGDSSVPAIWGVNEYRLAAGTHLIEVAVPPPPEAIGRGAEVSLGGDARLLFELELPEGTMTTIEAIAEIAMAVDAEGTGLASYAATIKAVFAPEALSESDSGAAVGRRPPRAFLSASHP
ncbi:hypothetical protein [Glycomyces arizonensis]|uniref:hypothetical protein n=1 Tax=Glycomyces arizonensis TaxID=256035 RepID=UPI00146FB3BF